MLKTRIWGALLDAVRKGFLEKVTLRNYSKVSKGTNHVRKGSEMQSPHEISVL
jgi:hypothetical protein